MNESRLLRSPIVRQDPGSGERLGTDNPIIFGELVVGVGDEYATPFRSVITHPGQAAQHRRVRLTAADGEGAQHHVPAH